MFRRKPQLEESLIPGMEPYDRRRDKRNDHKAIGALIVGFVVVGGAVFEGFTYVAPDTYSHLRHVITDWLHGSSTPSPHPSPESSTPTPTSVPSPSVTTSFEQQP